MAKAHVSSSHVFFLLFFLFAKINGSESNEEVGVYELKRGDFSVKLTNYGAVVISVILPDKNGSLHSPPLLCFFVPWSENMIVVSI